MELTNGINVCDIEITDIGWDDIKSVVGSFAADLPSYLTITSREQDSHRSRNSNKKGVNN